jgi:hypothetical protein
MLRRMSRLCSIALLFVAGCTAEAGAVESTSAAITQGAQGGYYLELEGQRAGRVSSSSGGGLKAEVRREDATVDGHTKKSIEAPTHEPLSLQVALDASPSLWNWVGRAWRDPNVTQSGTVSALDANMRISESLDFFDARVSEVRFPAMIANSMAAGSLAIKVMPEQTRRRAGSGATVGTSSPGNARWIVSNFRLTIDGLDSTNRVQRIESFTVKLPAPAAGFPGTSEPVDFPNLVVTIPRQYAQPWFDWLDDFVKERRHGDEGERQGQLDLLGPNLLNVLASMRLGNIGILRVTENAGDTVTAELYVEDMVLTVNH